MGALTTVLSRAAGRVTAVEIDKRLLPVLSDATKALKNVEIVHGDILKLDLAQLINEKMPDMEHHVCANLPYNITTPALTAFISADAFETITVMIQKEVAQRICAKPGSPEYGAFTVYVNYHAEPVMLFDVPPDCFIPRPKIFSSVITLKNLRERSFICKDEAMFFRVVRAAFGQRRKTLVNALYAAFGNQFSKEDISQIVIKCGLDVRTRGETLGVEEFAKLSDSLCGAQGSRE